jgi:hypothetical protein
LVRAANPVRGRQGIAGAVVGMKGGNAIDPVTNDFARNYRG